jgi:hypothetical protein
LPVIGLVLLIVVKQLPVGAVPEGSVGRLRKRASLKQINPISSKKLATLGGGGVVKVVSGSQLALPD